MLWKIQDITHLWHNFYCYKATYKMPEMAPFLYALTLPNIK